MQQMIRTTVNLPIDVHEEWRLESVQKKMSLGDLILEKTGRKMKTSDLDADFAFFDKIGRMGKQIDMVKALREDRDRDNG